MALLLVFFLSLLLTAAVAQLIRRTRLGRIFFDFPKERGMHTAPTPRVGGIAMFTAIGMLAILWMQRDLTAGIAMLSILLVAISLLDDLRPLPALLRLLVHAVTATLVVLLWVNVFGMTTVRSNEALRLAMLPVGALVIVLAIVWMTNLYNFMDGADGLAGGMSVIGFGTYAIASAQVTNSGSSLCLLSIVIAGASTGFLVFNFSPAKVFMGDAGSIPLGFLAATLGINGSLQQMWPWWFGVLVFSPFIVDASATLLRRTAQGKKPWIAHRDHYYQRLILHGWSHRKTALVYYCVMLAAGGSALYAIERRASSVVLSTWVITYALLLLLTEWHLHQKKNNKIQE
ncbi:MAG: glycosyltransferase family 4 protein [Betaproteobacteria bacterium]